MKRPITFLQILVGLTALGLLVHLILLPHLEPDYLSSEKETTYRLRNLGKHLVAYCRAKHDCAMDLRKIKSMRDVLELLASARIVHRYQFLDYEKDAWNNDINVSLDPRNLTFTSENQSSVITLSFNLETHYAVVEKKGEKTD